MALFPYAFMRTLDGQEGYHIPNPRYGLTENFPNLDTEITTAEGAGVLEPELKAIFEKLDPPIVHPVTVEEAMESNLPAVHAKLDHIENNGELCVMFFTEALTEQEYSNLSSAVDTYKNYGL